MTIRRRGENAYGVPSPFETPFLFEIMNMKRDDDFIRALLMKYEDNDYPYVSLSQAINMPPEQLKERYHVLLMCDAGFMVQMSGHGFRLTNQGHDYIDAIRNDTIWKKTKDSAAAVGGVTLSIMQDLAVAYLKEELASKIGMRF